MERPHIDTEERAACFKRLALDLLRSSANARRHGLSEVAKSQLFAARMCAKEWSRECGRESAHV